MREAVQNITLTNADQLKMPDLKNFEKPPMLPGNNCNNNIKAIHLDIHETSDALEITICTFLEYEIEGEHSADGLLDELEESIDLRFDSGHVLKGALSMGVKIIVASLTESPVIELDPIILQLQSLNELSGLASLGMFPARLSGNATLQGRFSLSYCPSCDGTHPFDGYERVGEDTSFYSSSLISYDLYGGLTLMAGIEGAQIGVGLDMGIKDENVFDDDPAVVQLPEARFITEFMKFSPENAVSKFPYVYTVIYST